MRLAVCAVLLVGCASSSTAPAPASPAVTVTGPPSAPAPFDRSSEDAFRASVRARMLGDRLVTSAEPGDEPLVLIVDGQRQLNLHRVWDLCTRLPDQCESEVSALITAVSKTEPTPPTREALVVTLRETSYAEHARSQSPEVWTEPFIGDLAVVYAFDEPDRIRIATTNDLATLGLTKPEAAALALANVQKAVGPADVARQIRPGATVLIAMQSGLETSLLLFADQWRAVAPTLPCTLLATAPEPNVLTITCGSDADVAKLRGMIADVLPRVERPLTAQVLVWRADRWQVVP